MFGDAAAQDDAAARARMVQEVDAMYAETRSETGLRGTPSTPVTCGSVTANVAPLPTPGLVT